MDGWDLVLHSYHAMSCLRRAPARPSPPFTQKLRTCRHGAPRESRSAVCARARPDNHLSTEKRARSQLPPGIRSVQICLKSTRNVISRKLSAVLSRFLCIILSVNMISVGDPPLVWSQVTGPYPNPGGQPQRQSLYQKKSQTLAGWSNLPGKSLLMDQLTRLKARQDREQQSRQKQQRLLFSHSSSSPAVNSSAPATAGHPESSCCCVHTCCCCHSCYGPGGGELSFCGLPPSPSPPPSPPPPLRCPRQQRSSSRPLSLSPMSEKRDWLNIEKSVRFRLPDQSRRPHGGRHHLHQQRNRARPASFCEVIATGGSDSNEENNVDEEDVFPTRFLDELIGGGGGGSDGDKCKWGPSSLPAQSHQRHQPLRKPPPPSSHSPPPPPLPPRPLRPAASMGHIIVKTPSAANGPPSQQQQTSLLPPPPPSSSSLSEPLKEGAKEEKLPQEKKVKKHSKARSLLFGNRFSKSVIVPSFSTSNSKKKPSQQPPPPTTQSEKSSPASSQPHPSPLQPASESSDGGGGGGSAKKCEKVNGSGAGSGESDPGYESDPTLRSLISSLNDASNAAEAAAAAAAAAGTTGHSLAEVSTSSTGDKNGNGDNGGVTMKLISPIRVSLFSPSSFPTEGSCIFASSMSRFWSQKKRSCILVVCYQL